MTARSGASGGRRAGALAAVLALAAALAGCGGAGRPAADLSWVPRPEVLPPVHEPNAQLPGQAVPLPRAPGGAPEPGSPNRSGPGRPGDPSVVASGLREPWGLVILPDGAALVGERGTGRILRIDPSGRTPATEVMRIGGVDASGDGGLLGLALSPAYPEDRLVFAYQTTRTDNRIIRFELGGQPAAIRTDIPRGNAGNGGQLAFGPDNLLYVGTGDTGRPELAEDRTSLAGKVLRLDEFGRPAPGNPTPGSPVYAAGHGNLAGICWTDTRQPFTTENDGSTAELNQELPGADYGWSTGRPGSGGHPPALTFDTRVRPVGGCAVVRFGLFVASLGGSRLLAVPLNGAGEPGRPRTLLAGVYGRLRTVQSAPDGALWLTTANRDGAGHPVPADDRVIRIMPPTETTTSPV
ncbi:MAG: PQQ-dependent sugar dehydrogenase [Actinobacteria bacterium]|nr:PQQ-dependent sugar dehydrogenase [Actinomycetota bacterium]